MRSLIQIAKDLSRESDSGRMSELAEEMHEVLREPRDRKRLLATCTNLSCSRPFHVTANNGEQVDFLNDLMVNQEAYGSVRLVVVCPHCGVHLKILASALDICTCGHEPHIQSAA